MQKGDVVKVYRDPMSEQDLEGEATVVAIESSNSFFFDRRIYYCYVKFPGDKARYYRKVLEPKDVSSVPAPLQESNIG